MNLKTYLRKKNLSAAMLARVLRVSRSTIYNWINGMRPHPKMAEKVQRITQGEVKMKDMGQYED